MALGKGKFDSVSLEWEESKFQNFILLVNIENHVQNQNKQLPFAVEIIFFLPLI